MQGNRLPDATIGEPGPGWSAWQKDGVPAPPGSYMKVMRHIDDSGELVLFAWYAVLPSGVICSIIPDTHRIDEHEDGTITVTPSIFDAPDGWHGHLVRGEWSE